MLGQTTLLNLILILLLSANVVQAGEEETATPDTIKEDFSSSAQPFLREFCVSCHGSDVAKGNLRLDQLDTDVSQRSNHERWRHILNRVRSGEMPPLGNPQPSKLQITSFLRALAANLDSAAIANRSDGRVILRRLNRVEYENTVRDLFDVDVSVRDMLPEDTISHGFDNVGEALNVSPVLIERYLEAADAVVNAAIAPVHAEESRTERFDLYDSLPKWFLAGTWKQEEGVILFRSGGDSASDLRKFRAPAPGRYRFRISASAHNSDTPLPMAALLGNFVVSGNPTRHLGYFDAPPGEPGIIEFEEKLLAKNDTIKVTPVALPFVYLKQETMQEYPGPGLHIHWIEVEGPLSEKWPTESYRRVYGDVNPKTGTLADAESLLKKLLPKAFRRPILSGEERPYAELVAAALNSGQTFEEAFRIGIKAVLTSPKFLYLRESKGPLDDYALASRLSYFLWSTTPDETLLSLAEKQELHQPQTLRDQVERMLQHSKAQAFTENFTGQWLSLRDINATTPDKTLYPEFDELLQWSSVRETHLFFEELLRTDLSVKNFVDSDFAMLNARLAKHYEIPDVHGVDFRRVELKPEYHRGGVLTQASILKVTANGTSTSPVLRGVWILDRILGSPASPPPPNVPAVEPDIRGATTIRDQLAKHQASDNCASCHTKIDPPGFALENFDVIGGWRTQYRVVAERKNWVNNRTGPLAKYLAAWQYGLGAEVESGDTLADGRTFSDITEFKKLLLDRPEQIARCVTEKLMIYATGHPISFSDHSEIDRIVTEAKSSDYGLRTLVHAVVASHLFQTK
jgi:mono/diheme cytochrome c family protein